MAPLKVYVSYRAFLSVYLAERKTAKQALTLQKFSQLVELSPSALQMIIKGERNLTIHKTHWWPSASVRIAATKDFGS